MGEKVVIKHYCCGLILIIAAAVNWKARNLKPKTHCYGKNMLPHLFQGSWFHVTTNPKKQHGTAPFKHQAWSPIKMTPCFSIDVWGFVQKLISLVTPLIGWGGISQGTPKYSWCSAKKFPSTTYSWKCPPRSLGPILGSFGGECFKEKTHDSHRFWRKDTSYFCVNYDNLRRIRKIPDKIMVLRSVTECELDSFLEKAKKKDTVSENDTSKKNMA